MGPWGIYNRIEKKLDTLIAKVDKLCDRVEKGYVWEKGKGWTKKEEK